MDDITEQIKYYNNLDAAKSIGWVPIPIQAGLLSVDGLVSFIKISIL